MYGQLLLVRLALLVLVLLHSTPRHETLTEHVRPCLYPGSVYSRYCRSRAGPRPETKTKPPLSEDAQLSVEPAQRHQTRRQVRPQ